MTTELTARLADYRDLRQGIETAILPLASSVDGLTFELQASLHHLELRRGGYVVLTYDGESRLGQVTDLHIAAADARDSGAAGGVDVRVRLAVGEGVFLEGRGRPCHDASVRPATPDEVGAWCVTDRPGRAQLRIGELLHAPGVEATLDSGGLGRHTFLCGQSGSGKTYSLGLLLERVLASTDLRVVVLDPNSDHVRLGHVRPGADPALVAGYAEVATQVAVWGDDPDADHPLRLRFADLDAATQAAILDLDPVRDREYALLTELLRHQQDGRSLVEGLDQLLGAGSPGARQLGLRADNLGVLGWSIWSPTLPSLVDELRNPSSRCTVVDLGSLSTPQEQRVVAQAVLRRPGHPARRRADGADRG
jgi:hypothetical protein